MSAIVEHSDCRAYLATLATNSLDACTTDPPYELNFMGREWDRSGIANQVELWREVYRVLKPGAHLVVFGGTRTYHRMVCAIEDAGFEIRDTLQWLYGSGFNKNRNCLKPAHEPICLARKPVAKTVVATIAAYGTGGINVEACRVGIAPGDDAAWRTGEYTQAGGVVTNFGQKGKPYRKDQPAGRWPPNLLLSHSAACKLVGARRVRGSGDPDRFKGRKKFNGSKYAGDTYSLSMERGTVANYAAPDGTETILAYDCAPDCPVAALDRQSGERPTGNIRAGIYKQTASDSVARGHFNGWDNKGHTGDTGGASRFYPILNYDPVYDDPFLYCAKASRAERNQGLGGMPALVTETHVQNRMRCQNCGGWQATGAVTIARRPNSTCQCENPNYVPQPDRINANANHHPTVKPVALCRWLVRLVTPLGGTALDPFAGSGSFGVACVLEGRHYKGCDQDAEYVEIANRRIAATQPALIGV